MDRVPFNKDELKTVGTYTISTWGRGPATIDKIDTPISPREHYLRMFKGEKPLWLPTGYDFVSINPGIVPDNVARASVMEINPFDRSTAGGQDWFGVEWEFVPKVGGSMVRPGAPKVPDITEWEKYVTFPDLSKIDWAKNAEENKVLFEDGERVVETTILNGFFERLISFMDFTEAAMALIDEDCKDGVHRLFSRLCDFYEELTAIFKKYYHIDQLCIHDDWGSQRAPFFSCDTIREMILPYIKRMVDFCHANDIIFELHSCGHNETLTPLMIEAGVDVWKPQMMNDFDLLYREYGDKIRIDQVPKSMDVYHMPTTKEEMVALAEEMMKQVEGHVGVCAPTYIGKDYFLAVYEMSRKAYENI